MRRFWDFWPFDKIKTQYGVLYSAELGIIAAIWRYFIWGLSYWWICLAVAVFLFQFLVYGNRAFVIWLNAPKKKKEKPKKAEIKKKKQFMRPHY